MKARARAIGTGTFLLALAAGAGAGCGGAQRASGDYVLTLTDEGDGAQRAVRQGPMPHNQIWTGVYQSPQIGEVQLMQTGDAVVGRYAYDRGSCHVVARIEGSVTGNLLRFRWREDHRPCGRIAPVTGRAYFLYWMDNEGQRARIDGEWGYDEDHGRGRWTGYKIPSRRPDFNESEGSGEGSGDGLGSGDGAGDGAGGGGDGAGGGGTSPKPVARAARRRR